MADLTEPYLVQNPESRVRGPRKGSIWRRYSIGGLIVRGLYWVSPESRIQSPGDGNKHTSGRGCICLWTAFKRVCFRSFGNLIDAPRSGEGGGAIRSSTRIQNPKIRVPGWPLHRHLSNGPLSKPTAIQTLLESGLEQTGRIRQDAFQFPQTCCKDTLPTNVRRWESLDPKVGDPPGF